MRITREVLTKFMREAVQRLTRTDRNLVAVYLCGSLLDENYMVGGVADIDLGFIHNDPIAVEREIQPVTDEVHLDIAHYYHRDFRQTRQLREHPWLGPTLKNCQILYDPQHFMDFTQASVRGQFDRPDHVLQRVRRQLDTARQVWSNYHSHKGEATAQDIRAYLKALHNAAGAVASLGARLLTERRFLLLYRQWVDTLGKPGLYAGLTGLLGIPHLNVDAMRSWLAPWEAAIRAIPADQAPARLHVPRVVYYRRAIEVFFDSDYPADGLWPLINTWTLAICHLPADHPAQAEWQVACERLGWAGEGFIERIQALDAYLDTIEETIDQWAQANGAEFQS